MPAPLRILVVEDSRDSRELLCEMLDVLGHDAHGAATAEEGIALLDGPVIDVLIADIDIPGSSGVELARIALNNIPNIKIIFGSNYAFLVSDKTDFNFFLLPKPYAFNQLKYAIDTISGTIAPNLS